MTAKIRPSEYRAWFFLVLAVSGTWALWWIAVAIGRPMSDPLTISLFAAGGLFVPTSALFLTYATLDPIAVHDYWLRLFDFRRLSFRGFARLPAAELEDAKAATPRELHNLWPS